LTAISTRRMKASRNSTMDASRIKSWVMGQAPQIFPFMISSSGRLVTSGIGTVGVHCMVASIAGTWAIRVLCANAVRWYPVPSSEVRLCLKASTPKFSFAPSTV